jgi:polysaccharide biosynthesis/export protein
MQKNNNLKIHRSLLIVTLSLMVSCVPYKKVRYFNDFNNLNQQYSNAREQKKIVPFDNLYIRVLSTDEKTAKIFNADNEIRSTTTTSMISYSVDEKGNIDFPFVGNIDVGGLTTSEAGDKIQKALSEYIANTSVLVKFIDNKVTIMGEVERQGIYPFADDKLNVYEALSLAGGLTRYGNHKKIVIVRQEGSEIKHYKLDLSDSKIANSGLYYVLPNDVLIVEPLRAVSFSYQNETYGTILSTITTVVALLYFMFNTKL